MTMQAQQFSVAVADGYIHLKTWGGLDEHNLDAPANAALALAAEKQVDKLLDDIRGVDSTGVSIAIQSKAMGILWKLRSFKKVAIILEGSRLSKLFFSTLSAFHFNADSKFKGFNNEAEAIAWLRSE